MTEPAPSRSESAGERLPCVILRSRNTMFPWRCDVCDALYVSPVGFAETTTDGLRCPKAVRDRLTSSADPPSSA